MKERIDRTDSVLLIIDVQNDFCPGGSLAVEYGDTIIPRINSLMHRFPLVVATRDWHPSGHVSFADAHPDGAPGDTVTHNGIEQQLWPAHCVQGTSGADFHPDLDRKPINLILHKGTSSDLDSYSAFFENDHTTPTGLEGYLKGLGIRKVYIAGLAEDVCVRFSAEDAVGCGFETFVIADCTRGVDIPQGSVQTARRSMQDRNVGYIQSTDLKA
jgi:nicotinamidase/pyrazinamidase